MWEKNEELKGEEKANENVGSANLATSNLATSNLASSNLATSILATSSNLDSENKFANINLKVEAYGEGDYRLLRYMPDGSCVFEEAPDEKNKNKKNLQQYAQIFCSAMEKRILIKSSSSTNSNDNNSSSNNCSSKNRNNNNSSDIMKNDKEWKKGEEYRIMVEKDLEELMILFDMLLGTLNYNKGTKYLSLNKCYYYRDTDENKQDIYIAITNRKELLEKLRKLCQQTRLQINSINGIIAQKYFLFFIDQLIKHWKILNKKYAEIEYMQVDNNFPYVTQVSVEFFFLPSIFWKLSSNPIFLSWPPYPSFSPFKSQYAHITFSLSSLKVKSIGGDNEHGDDRANGCITSLEKVREEINFKHKVSQSLYQNKIFLSDNQNDSKEQVIKEERTDMNGLISDISIKSELTKDNHTQTAQQNCNFYYSNRKEEEMKIFDFLDNTSIISVQFEGLAAHLIEQSYCIQLDLYPLNVKLRRRTKGEKLSSPLNRGNTNSRNNDNSSNVNSSSNNDGGSNVNNRNNNDNDNDNNNNSRNINNNNSRNINNNNSRNINYVCNGNIARPRKGNFPEKIIPENITFKQAKKVHEKLTEAQWVLIDKSIFCILAEQANNLKDNNNELLINLDYYATETNRKIKIHCTQINHKSIEFLINDINILSSSKKNIPVDFSFVILYSSADIFTSSDSNVTNEKNINTCTVHNNRNDKDDVDSFDDVCSNKNENDEVTIDYELIQMLLNLSLAKVRDLFICSWKYFSFETPYYSADIHPIIYQNVFPDHRSDTLITNFFAWLITSMERYLRLDE
ncbi:mediator of RNA polymerase II transcription subunit 17 [Plasmodium brasilianum]|uniref:Mediator of RNA polymerase II transcription subunit 17 n=1 Tax=Plasmodium brasilianum TaxID=5824 RepID=A0ACB9Y7B5_PLABR|nr:mediator of RNA polymerase II transcription subunit 17 [Plasmodium brasilianum]